MLRGDYRRFRSPMTITISTKRTIRVLALVVLFLTLANLAAQLYKFDLVGLGPTFDLNQDGSFVTFDFEEEQNVPTWYASATLLLCAILLAAIAAARRAGGDRFAPHWYALAAVFLLMSIDEAATLHEKLGSAVGRLLETEGIFYYAWVIPAAIFLILFLLAMRNFILNLPAKTRWLFLAAGAIFVGGALALELVEGYYADFYSTTDLTSAILASGEDLLEMLGTLVFIYALLSYVSSYLEDVHVRVVDGK